MKSTITKITVAFLFFLAIVTLGCNAENPICTDNFCAIGEVFPRSELDETQPFSEVDIDDSDLIAMFSRTPTPVKTVPIQPVNTVTLADIVTDVESGSRKYLNQTVTITATVRTPNSVFKTGSITIVTNTDTSFFITDRESPDRMNPYKRGQTYIFTVYIRSISPPDADFDNYAVFSNLIKSGAKK